MKRTLSYGEIAEVSLELSLLLHAGVGTGDALYLLGEDSPHKKLLSAMADDKGIDHGWQTVRMNTCHQRPSLSSAS